MSSQAVRQVAKPTMAGLADAYACVRRLVSPSPLIASPMTGEDCWLKLEMLHATGSFKLRGAVAALSRLPPDTSVVSCSAGNHGLAVAHVARRLGIHACIVVSESASPRKIALLRRHAAELVIFGASYDDAERHATELARARGAYYLSPYNDPDVILGQASIGVEILGVFDGPVTIVCPVGGGGLAAGIGMALAARPGSILIGVEAAQSSAMATAIKHGKVVSIEAGPTLAEGLAGNLEDGTVTVALLAEYADAMVTVTEAEIGQAMRHLGAAHGIIAEGAGAVATAAILAKKIPQSPRQPVIALVSGRNIDLATWAAAAQSSTAIDCAAT